MSTPRADDKLTTAQAAELTGMKPTSWRSGVSRGRLPAADGHSDPCGCPWWYRRTITAHYLAKVPAGVRS